MRLVRQSTPANAPVARSGRRMVDRRAGRSPGAGDWPLFAPAQWVPVNGDYGYGCACLQIIVSARGPATRPAQVRRIVAAQALPLGFASATRRTGASALSGCGR
ncbi:MAG: DUF4087 domain-containing protein [Burkholderiaceae bacterium]